jgi:hypothetical protein
MRFFTEDREDHEEDLPEIISGSLKTRIENKEFGNVVWRDLIGAVLLAWCRGRHPAAQSIEREAAIEGQKTAVL